MSFKKVTGLNKIIICSIYPLKKWIAATAPLKKSPYMKEWMVQADAPKEQYPEKKIKAINPPKKQKK